MDDQQGYSLLRAKTLSGSQNLFGDVLEQLSNQEETLPRQTSLYTLPSMTFLESLLDEMDSRSASQGIKPPDPPMYLPIDSFDLPGLDAPGNSIENIEELGLPAIPQHETHSCPVFENQGSATVMHNQMTTVPPPPSPFIGITFAPTAGSAAPSPQKQERSRRPIANNRYIPGDYHASFEDDEDDLDFVEVAMGTSKSARQRKSSTHVAGTKRKCSDALTYVSAPVEYGNRKGSSVSSYAKRVDGDCDEVTMKKPKGTLSCVLSLSVLSSCLKCPVPTNTILSAD